MTVPGLSPTRRNFIVISAATLALGGCGGIHLLEPATTPGSIYMLSPDFPAPASGARLAWQMVVAVPETSASLSSDRIAIRRGDVLDYYAAAQWSDTAPDMVQSLLLQALDKGGAMGAVGKDTEGLHADFVLQSQIRAFDARYDQPDGAPVAEIEIAITLATAARGHIIASNVFRKEAPAGANSVAAAVQAFDQASGPLFGEIAAWAIATASASKDTDKSR